MDFSIIQQFKRQSVVDIALTDKAVIPYAFFHRCNIKSKVWEKKQDELVWKT